MDQEIYSYEWIETLSRLEEVAGLLGQAPIIGVDLEADSLYHYFEKVCLLQIDSEAVSYVLDPLALKDLSSLRPVFSNPRIRKVFHGADYDIRSLSRDFKIEVENLFDTQLACRFLGLAETGLEAVLRNRFQVELNKKFQRADWSRRPIPREMVEYAAMDGRYLVLLAGLLERELEEKGRLSWVEEECAFLTKVRFAPPGPVPLYLRVKGAFGLEARSLAVLEALLKFREAVARKSDRPPFKVIGAEVLLELAIQKPLDMEALETGKILSQRQIERHGTSLLNEIHRALAIPETDLPVFPPRIRSELSQPERSRVKALRRWREKEANDLAIEPGILLNNALINGLAYHNPGSREDLAEVPGLKKWQQDYYGSEILAALKRAV